jgi:hypothetical protein
MNDSILVYENLKIKIETGKRKMDLKPLSSNSFRAQYYTVSWIEWHIKDPKISVVKTAKSIQENRKLEFVRRDSIILFNRIYYYLEYKCKRV